MTMAWYLVWHMRDCRNSWGEPSKAEEESIPAVAAKIVGDYEGQMIQIEQPNSHSKLYRVKNGKLELQ